MLTVPGWRSVEWLQRGLVIGVVGSAMVVATTLSSTSFATSTVPTALLWGTAGLNALLLLVLGPTALVTTRRWFRQGLPPAQLRQQRRTVRRRAVLLGLVAYLTHQTLVVLLDPRFSLEVLIGRRRMFIPIAPFPDRVQLASAFTALAFGYVVLAWLLWRSAGLPGLVPSDTQLAGSLPVLDAPPPPLFAAPRADVIETLPRDPVTGRVVRQFDI